MPTSFPVDHCLCGEASELIIEVAPEMDLHLCQSCAATLQSGQALRGRAQPVQELGPTREAAGEVFPYDDKLQYPYYRRA